MTLESMLAGVIDARLDGAACAGLFFLFDAPEPGDDPIETDQRRRLALDICADCAIVAACSKVADEWPRTRRAGFVLGGRIFNNRGVEDA